MSNDKNNDGTTNPYPLWKAVERMISQDYEANPREEHSYDMRDIRDLLQIPQEDTKDKSYNVDYYRSRVNLAMSSLRDHWKKRIVFKRTRTHPSMLVVIPAHKRTDNAVNESFQKIGRTLRKEKKDLLAPLPALTTAEAKKRREAQMRNGTALHFHIDPDSFVRLADLRPSFQNKGNPLPHNSQFDRKESRDDNDENIDIDP